MTLLELFQPVGKPLKVVYIYVFYFKNNAITTLPPVASISILGKRICTLSRCKIYSVVHLC